MAVGGSEETGVGGLNRRTAASDDSRIIHILLQRPPTLRLLLLKTDSSDMLFRFCARLATAGLRIESEEAVSVSEDVANPLDATHEVT